MDNRYYPLDYFRQMRFPYPKLVFCDSAFGLFGFLIRRKTKGSYSHFMIEVGPGMVASQSFLFRLQDILDFKFYHLKYVVGVHWTSEARQQIIDEINVRLKLPWYRKLYDIVGVLGHAIGLEKLNIPWLNFCSEWGRLVKIADPEFDLESPTPTDINEWTKARKDKYKVVGRYTPD